MKVELAGQAPRFARRDSAIGLALSSWSWALSIRQSRPQSEFQLCCDASPRSAPAHAFSTQPLGICNSQLIQRPPRFGRPLNSPGSASPFQPPEPLTARGPGGETNGADPSATSDENSGLHNAPRRIPSAMAQSKAALFSASLVKELPGKNMRKGFWCSADQSAWPPSAGTVAESGMFLLPACVLPIRTCRFAPRFEY